MENTPVKTVRTVTRRWSSTTWVLMGLCVVILLVAGDMVRRAVQGTNPVADVPGKTVDVGLVYGSPAIDVELPDMNGKPHRLSDWRGKQFVLTFFCGCNECRHFAETLAGAYKQQKGPVPPTVVVMTPSWEPSATPSLIQSTNTEKWTYLFSEQKPDIVDRYRGHPCPKVYVIDPEFKVSYVSPTATPDSHLFLVRDVTAALGMHWQPPKPMVKPRTGKVLPGMAP